MTGAVDGGFNPPTIPDVVYALGYRSANQQRLRRRRLLHRWRQPGQEGCQLRQGHWCRHGLEPERRRPHRVAGDQRQRPVRVHRRQLRQRRWHRATTTWPAPTPPPAPRTRVQFGNNKSVPGRIDGRVFSIAIAADNITPYVAIGPAKPGGTNGGNKFVAYDPTTGLPTWIENGPDGDAQAIELIGGTLYGGFHGGWNGNTAKRLEGLNPASGATTGFDPDTNGLLGVRGLAAGGGRLVAVGDFSSMGTTNKLDGLAIFN